MSLDYSVLYIADGKVTTLDDMLVSVKWSGDVMQAARKLDVTLKNVSDFYADGKKRRVNILMGKEARFMYKGAEMFRGVIFSTSININGDFSFTAYDENIYLTKNEDSRRFVKKKASEIAALLCKEFGVARGQIDDTVYTIPKLIFRSASIYDMIITALTESRKHGSGNFILGNTEGKLTLLARKKQAVQWVLENGVNIIDASYDQNIEELRNQVKVIGGEEKKPVIATVKNDAMIKTYGLMQHIELADAEASKAELQTLAKELLKQLCTIDDEARISALGIITVYAGKAVYVKEPMTNIMGSYYVSTDTHTIEGNTHTMDLTLTATDELPKMEYEAPPE